LQSSPWPSFEKALVDERAEERGDLIMALITEIRREKAEKRLPLNTQIKELTVYASDQETAEAIAQGGEDISGACKVVSLKVLGEKGEGRALAEFTNVRFVTEY
jgi:valyl-tRNA synthetase